MAHLLHSDLCSKTNEPGRSFLLGCLNSTAQQFVHAYLLYHFSPYHHFMYTLVLFGFCFHKLEATQDQNRAQQRKMLSQCLLNK